MRYEVWEEGRPSGRSLKVAKFLRELDAFAYTEWLNEAQGQGPNKVTYKDLSK